MGLIGETLLSRLAPSNACALAQKLASASCGLLGNGGVGEVPNYAPEAGFGLTDIGCGRMSDILRGVWKQRRMAHSKITWVVLKIMGPVWL